MRTSRFRCDDNGMYYHLLNRVAGDAGYFPFGDLEKTYMINLLKKLSKFYTVDVLSYCIMSNHYHLIVYATDELPSTQELKRRWIAYYGTQKSKLKNEPDWADSRVVDHWQQRLRDISCFMKDFQQLFTIWFNRRGAERRRGGLWADRFKSVILEPGKALWDCIKYIELNPLRAHMVREANDYRFSSFGEYNGSGKHPFAENISKHLRSYFSHEGYDWSTKRFVVELMKHFDLCFQQEANVVYNADESVQQRKLATVNRRFRYWSDGAIIGSKEFVQQMSESLLEAEQAAKKRFDRLLDGDRPFYSFRQLRA